MVIRCEARTWLDIFRLVGAVSFRFEVFGTSDDEILLKQGNIPRVASEDCNDYVSEDRNYATSTSDRQIVCHRLFKPIGDPERRKWLQRIGGRE